MSQVKIYQNHRSVYSCVSRGGGYCGYKLIKHEQSQNNQIYTLQHQVAVLTERVMDGPAVEFTSKVGVDSFDYLAIGNSITIHPVTDFWWGEWGMAASQESQDYYHLVVEGLNERDSTSTEGNVVETVVERAEVEEINTAVYNYAVWETQAHDRTETYEFLDKWLVDGIDLVTVQLSENASDLSTFEVDLKSLLNYIKEKCGNKCQIIVIDDFWSDEKSRVKSDVCSELNISFVDLSDIRGKEEYKAGMDRTVKGTGREDHIINHSGVAAHPGDEGMRVIAERILEKIE